MLFVWEASAELPQSKPDGFASSLWEGANPLSLLTVFAASSPEGGAFSAPPASVLALSVTCGDSSPKGRALGIAVKFPAQTQSLR